MSACNLNPCVTFFMDEIRPVTCIQLRPAQHVSGYEMIIIFMCFLYEDVAQTSKEKL